MPQLGIVKTNTHRSDKDKENLPVYYHWWENIAFCTMRLASNPSKIEANEVWDKMKQSAVCYRSNKDSGKTTIKLILSSWQRCTLSQAKSLQRQLGTEAGTTLFKYIIVSRELQWEVRQIQLLKIHWCHRFLNDGSLQLDTFPFFLHRQVWSFPAEDNKTILLSIFNLLSY
jgi:hypothetical protein